MRLVGWLALPAGALLLSIHVAAAQASDEVRQACTPDAMRLCSEFIPDVPKITACMRAKHSQISALCRRAMAHGHSRAYRYRSHRGRSYRHCGRGRHCG
jgi:hypothetical protein